jgi:phenylacetate-CoA ligase
LILCAGVTILLDHVKYQFIQETPVQYRIKLNLRDRFKREQEMTNMLKEFLGKDAVLIFERVDEIPALSSGKRKYVVNGMRS